ncbi:SMC-Scp complex subunit ScpB [Salisediminibacterium beveridgei]|uniref:Segregation and condensation protein B n=1 Tax=Salisediminibacterium beveridgei TaxID=632773 RepID=A0A1D7QUR2_9BACI|nr:SMC-Scp complex subunit ScpB [Salisediminibacterium beveridgei]AOM82754.1 Segregation and condensation protein B [Salisediminibacterium beveridgei]
MQSQEIKAIIEGLLFVSGEEGIDEKQLMNVLSIDRKSLKFYLHELKDMYASSGRGIQLSEAGGIYQLTTKEEHVDYFKKLVQSPSSTTLSQAALECLAIVAYRQPVSRIEIEDIRGVKSERPLRTLVSKELVKETGRATGTGRAILFGTTRFFLEQFGLTSLEELPDLSEHVDEEELTEEMDLFYDRFSESLDIKQENKSDIEGET